jgi:FkbM family methyltransferase
MRRRRRALEGILIGIAIFITGAALASMIVGKMFSERAPRTINLEAQALSARFGPAQHSQFGEEWIIRDFFNDKRGGVFVDVGASHYKEFSNTYYLETALGWSGLAIDPLTQFEPDYVKYRPKTRYRAFFVSDRSNEEAKVYLLKERTRVTSSDKSFTARYGQGAVEIVSPTITLDDLLESENVQAIDFLSMDIELAEPKALAGFDIERFKPILACVEGHAEVRQQIIDYFAHHGYVVIGKYLRADTQNLWFTTLPKPAGDTKN